jgi:hypothetical protein
MIPILGIISLRYESQKSGIPISIYGFFSKDLLKDTDKVLLDDLKAMDVKEGVETIRPRSTIS